MKLISLHRLRADQTNPRQRDEKRMELVQLSLKKLGFVLPIYVDKSDMILSGHQRTDAARELGLTKVPVETVTHSNKAALNLLFNRSTNDFAIDDYRNGDIDVDAIAALGHALPDVTDLYPCLKAEAREVMPLAKVHAAQMIDYAGMVGKSLARKGVHMPIVLTEGGYVVNGIGRLQHAAERGWETINCVTIPNAATVFARAVLNTLSMDFDMSRVEDDLRPNAFRRARQKRTYVGSGFIFPLTRKAPKHFDLKAERERWFEVYGKSILDFGAGHGTEAAILRGIGAKVTTFEPYPCHRTRDELDVSRGRRSAREFLDAVAAGREFDSIVLSSVLNSVPFPADRAHIVTICAALASRETQLFAVARSRADATWQGITTGGVLSDNTRGMTGFPLESEDGAIIGDVPNVPKIQKYFGSREFYDLFRQRFETVSIGRHMNAVTAWCADPLPIDIAALRAALLFEFDLPYPGGRRMGLADRALKVFSQRLGVLL